MPETKSPDPQPAADQDKKANPKNVGKAKKDSNEKPLPVLLEFTITACVIVLVVVFFAIVGVSIYTGANLMGLVIRTSVSVLVIGILLVMLAGQVVQGMRTAGMLGNGKGQGKPKAK